MNMAEKFHALLNEGQSTTAAVKSLSEESLMSPEEVCAELVDSGIDRRRFNMVLRRLESTGTEQKETDNVQNTPEFEQEDSKNGQEADENGDSSKDDLTPPDDERELLTVGWLIRSMGLPDNVREQKLVIRIRAEGHEGELTIRGKSWLLPVAEHLTVESWSPSWDKPGELWVQVVPPGAGKA